LFEGLIQIETNTQLLLPNCDADVADSHLHTHITFIDGEDEK